MNIGISQEALVDIGLNLAGFLTAGILMALIYSIFNSRRKVPAAAGSVVPIKLPDGPANESTEVNKTANVAFVDFKTMARNNNCENQPPPKRQVEGNSRNRQEVIRLARKLLADKHNEAQIKRTLPITDGELSMVKQTLGDRSKQRRES